MIIRLLVWYFYLCLSSRFYKGISVFWRNFFTFCLLNWDFFAGVGLSDRPRLFLITLFLVVEFCADSSTKVFTWVTSRAKCLSNCLCESFLLMASSVLSSAIYWSFLLLLFHFYMCSIQICKIWLVWSIWESRTVWIKCVFNKKCVYIWVCVCVSFLYVCILWCHYCCYYFYWYYYCYF